MCNTGQRDESAGDEARAEVERAERELDNARGGNVEVARLRLLRALERLQQIAMEASGAGGGSDQDSV